MSIRSEEHPPTSPNAQVLTRISRAREAGIYMDGNDHTTILTAHDLQIPPYSPLYNASSSSEFQALRPVASQDWYQWTWIGMWVSVLRSNLADHYANVQNSLKLVEHLQFLLQNARSGLALANLTLDMSSVASTKKIIKQIVQNLEEAIKESNARKRLANTTKECFECLYWNLMYQMGNPEVQRARGELRDGFDVLDPFGDFRLLIPDSETS